MRDLTLKLKGTLELKILGSNEKSQLKWKFVWMKWKYTTEMNIFEWKWKGTMEMKMFEWN